MSKKPTNTDLEELDDGDLEQAQGGLKIDYDSFTDADLRDRITDESLTGIRIGNDILRDGTKIRKQG